MIRAIVLLLACSGTAVAVVIGTCDTDTEPKSWLRTAGHGLSDWGTAGVVPNGKTFCVVGNRSAEVMEAAYQIDLSGVRAASTQITLASNNQTTNLTNACLNQDPRIHYCVPFCGNDTLQLAMIDAALRSHGSPALAARIVAQTNQSPLRWAYTVIRVDLHANPQARIVVGTFLDSAWCSVYVGMQTTGEPYLYEMEAGIVL